MEEVVDWLSRDRYSVLSLESKKRKSRFSLLQLEHGEQFLHDYGVTLSNGNALPQAGRLKCCSRSLVFEPSDVRLPLLKLCLRSVDDSPVSTRRNPDRIVVGCETAVEMQATGPFASRDSEKTGGYSRYFEFAPQHTRVEELRDSVEALRRVSLRARREGGHAEAQCLEPLTRGLAVAKFEMSQLVDFREDVVAQCRAERVTPLLRQPGVVVVTTARLYFEPAALNDVGGASVSVPFSRIISYRKARHMMRRCALEVQLGSSNKKDVLRLAFDRPIDRDSCFRALSDKRRPSSSDQEILRDASKAWRERKLDNFGYLCVLNHLADRSLHDLSQYPVFPWILADYDNFDLHDPKSFRDLSKPIGAIDDKRLRSFQERYQAMSLPPTPPRERDERQPAPPPRRASFNSANDVVVTASRMRSFVQEKFLSRLQQPFAAATSSSPPSPPQQSSAPPPLATQSSADGAEEQEQPKQDRRDAPFLYGTHYSTPGYVAFYLVRSAPEYTLCLQNGRFDAADRMFTSVPHAWSSVRSNSTDLKELIPEFYQGDGSFLTNARNVPLGTTQSGQKLGDVELAKWAKSPADFVKKMRQALESDYVSARLHLWIDLVFGYKQRGEAAAEAQNLFHPLTYEDAVEDWDTLEPRDRAAIETQIDEFGQTPTQLFQAPHPSRDAQFQDEEAERRTRLGAPSSSARPAPSLRPNSSSSSSALAGSMPSSSSQARRLSSPLDQHGVSPLNSSKLLATADHQRRGPRPVPAPEQQDPPAAAPRDDGIDNSNGVVLRNHARIEEKEEREAAAPRRRSPPPSQRRSASRVVSLEVAGRGARAHRDAITGAAFAKGVVASVSRDGALKVCSFRSGESFLVPRRSMIAPAPLSCVCLTDDARLAVTGGLDSSLSVYSVDQGAAVARVDDAHDAALSAAVVGQREIVTGALDASVKLWSVAESDSREIVAFYDHESPVSCVAASGRLVAAGAEDGRVLIWDARDDAGGPLGSAVLPDSIAAIAFEQAGSSILALSQSGHIARLALDGRHLDQGSKINADCASLAIIDSRPDKLDRAKSSLAGPYAVIGTRSGDVVVLDLPNDRRPKHLCRLNKAHNAAVNVLVPVFDDHPDDPMETFILSASEDCTVKAWSVVRDDLAV